MDFKISKSSLIKQLGLINTIVPAKSAKPILECILLDAVGSSLTITATDLSISTFINLGIDNKEDGKVLLHSKKFFTMVKSLPDGEVRIKKTGKSIRITSGSVKFSLAITEDFEEFPAVPQSLTENSFSIDSLKFKEYISKTVFAASMDELRAVLTGVLCSLEKGKLTMVATDSLRLTKIEDKNVSYTGGNVDLILPARTLQVISNAITDSNETCEVFFEDNYIEVRLKGITIFSRVINGKYPAYKAIIPPVWEKRFKIDRIALSKSLGRTAIACNPLTKRIKLSFNDNDELTVSAIDSTTASKAEEVITIEDFTPPVSKEPILEIGLNYTKVASLLKSIDDEYIYFDVNSPTKPILINPVEGSENYDYTTLFMPIKISE